MIKFTILWVWIRGESVEQFMSHLWTILYRIATPVKSTGVASLGLHPFLYFYNDKRFQITSFLAWFSIVFEMHERSMQIDDRTIGFKEFTRIRRSIEFLITNFPVATIETVGKFCSVIKGYDRLQIVYKAFICLSLKMGWCFKKYADIKWSHYWCKRRLSRRL